MLLMLTVCQEKVKGIFMCKAMEYFSYSYPSFPTTQFFMVNILCLGGEIAVGDKPSNLYNRSKKLCFYALSGIL